MLTAQPIDRSDYAFANGFMQTDILLMINGFHNGSQYTVPTIARPTVD